MTALAARPVKSGSVIVKEYGADVGFNRTPATVAVTSTMEVGRVVKTDGDGTWSSVVAADVAGISGTDLRIVIGDNLYEIKETATLPTDLTVAVLEAASGVMIGDANLSFGDTLTSGQIEDVIDELKVQGFKVASQAPQA